MGPHGENGGKNKEIKTLADLKQEVVSGYQTVNMDEVKKINRKLVLFLDGFWSLGFEDAILLTHLFNVIIKFSKIPPKYAFLL